MELFEFIQLGFDHIIDVNGVDHILFVATLCSLYYLDQWKRLLWLVTAFTVGHCITLILSSLRMVNISPSLVETLIPLTIILTAIYNIYIALNAASSSITFRWHYIVTLIFGLIHGLGFSNFFRQLFDEDEQIIFQLLGFNIGVELGQILVVVAISSLGFIVSLVGDESKKIWTVGLSVLAIVKSVQILFS